MIEALTIYLWSHGMLPKLRLILITFTLGSLVSMSLQAKTILIVGDSISAAYGMSPEQGWVKLLQQRIEQKYPKQHRVVNASVSGETTSGALARLPKLLGTYKPEIVVIELGGNDGLRGQPPQLIQRNLSQLIQLSKNSKAQVLLFGMKIPPNYGTSYSKAFENNYQVVAKQHNIQLMPFFLEGIAGNNALMQADLVHPNAKAQTKLLDSAWKYIEPSLKK